MLPSNIFQNQNNLNFSPPPPKKKRKRKYKMAIRDKIYDFEDPERLFQTVFETLNIHGNIREYSSTAVDLYLK
jgi:hypothetical protein